MQVRLLRLLAFVMACGASAHADELVYQYEGNVLPNDPSAGWILVRSCDPNECTKKVESGHFVIEYLPSGGGTTTYARFIYDGFGDSGELPPTLWVEWSYRSNQPPTIFPGCDSEFAVSYDEILDQAFLYSDTVECAEGGCVIDGLDPLEFQTHRFESLDGLSYRFSVNGIVYNEFTTNDQGQDVGNIQFHCNGGCTQSMGKINEWDYVRHGTIDGNEQILSFDPPGNPTIVEPFDRFRVVFDQPGYVYIDDIEVTTTAVETPIVKYTWRRDGDGPETLEVVLDRLLPADETTTFRFPTISGAPEVSYTPQNVTGACCLSIGACQVTDDATCVGWGGSFIVDAVCDQVEACCLPSGACDDLAPVCCTATNGTGQGSATVCEGDADNDGIDGLCGDACPNDFFNDADGDGLCADVDDCPQLNPNDANNNGTPDCLEPPVIPTVSTWGLVILAMALVVCFRVVFMRPHRT